MASGQAEGQRVAAREDDAHHRRRRPRRHLRRQDHARMNDLSPQPGVTYADIEAAAARLEGVAHRTPVATSTPVRRAARAARRTSSARTSSAWARSSSAAPTTRSRKLDAEQRKRGVVAFSSGNHAQAVALAGQLLGVPATIVMPADAPAVKVAATRGYGAEVVLYDRAGGEPREDRAEARRRARQRRSFRPSTIPT